MLRAAQAFLGIAAIGFLLIVTNTAVVGPCTDTFGALALFAVVLGTPTGFVLLVWSVVTSRRQKALSSEESSHTDIPQADF